MRINKDLVSAPFNAQKDLISRGALNLAAFLGLVTASGALFKKRLKSYDDASKLTEKDIDKLKDIANLSNLPVVLNSPSLNLEIPDNNAFYVSPRHANFFIKNLIKDEILKQQLLKNTDKGIIFVGKNTNIPSVLAHELGHAKIYNEQKGIFHKTMQEISPISRKINMIASPLLLSPYVRHKLYGGWGGAGRGALFGTLFSFPALINEATASLEALKLLEKSKHDVSRAKKDLLAAYGSYLAENLAVPATYGAVFHSRRVVPKLISRIVSLIR